MAQIAVIVPIYKVEPYLRRCVDSILMQTFMDFELILVDDGSPDNCGAICDEYAKKDSRVYVIHQENKGLSAARNAGIDWVFANSNSEWLNFVDSDDWVHPEYLERIYHAVLEHNVKVSICGYEETDGEIHWTNADAAQVKLWPVEQFYVERNVNATVAVCKLYHKECFADIRYPVGKIHEDEYVTYRILFAHEQIAVIDAPMYAYFVNPEGITKSEWTPKRLDVLDAIQGQYRFFRKNSFDQAYKRQLYVYWNVLCTQLQRIQGCAEEKKGKMRRKTRWRLIRILIVHHKEIAFRENKWAYEIAFPRMMNLYWHVCVIRDKLFGK